MQTVYLDSKPLSKRNVGKLVTLLALAIVTGSVGCVSTRLRPEYKVSIPTAKIQPLLGKCNLDGSGERECVLVDREFVESAMRELTAACLANGQTRVECGVKE